jgi:hypothetical protein
MRIRHELPDKRILEYAGRSRYVAFRLTMNGAYVFQSGTSALDVTLACKRMNDLHGFKTLALDSVDGAVLATYPTNPALHG